MVTHNKTTVFHTECTTLDLIKASSLMCVSVK